MFYWLCAVLLVVCCSLGCVLFSGLCTVLLVVCCSTGGVLFYWLCVVLLAVCCSTGCVLFYLLCTVLRVVCCSTGCVLFYWLYAALGAIPCFTCVLFYWLSPLLLVMRCSIGDVVLYLLCSVLLALYWSAHFVLFYWLYAVPLIVRCSTCWVLFLFCSVHGPPGRDLPLTLLVHQASTPAQPFLDYRCLSNLLMSQPGQAAPTCQDTLRKRRHAGDPDVLHILDIRKAYLQVHIAPELQQYQAVLWWEKVYASVLSTCLTGRPLYSFSFVLSFNAALLRKFVHELWSSMMGNSNLMDNFKIIFLILFCVFTMAQRHLLFILLP